jgi:hypothetical protein
MHEPNQSPEAGLETYLIDVDVDSLDYEALKTQGLYLKVDPLPGHIRFWYGHLSLEEKNMLQNLPGVRDIQVVKGLRVCEAFAGSTP